jgi:DNA topoisomerase-1
MPPKKTNSTKSDKSTISAKFSKNKTDSTGKTLVIVESPGKIKKIQDILGDSYIVAASVGHIIDLAAKNMSVDISNNFTPSYETLNGKESVIRDLKRYAKSADKILLATDEDREGEMIAWSIAYVLDLKDANRITFNSITETEILNAVANPRKIDINLVDAQKSRRILDRIVGFEISPLLWKSIGQSLSAGRVQSVVVRIILDKEREIQKFLKEDISSDFKFKGLFNKNINAQLYQTKINNKLINNKLINNKLIKNDENDNDNENENENDDDDNDDDNISDNDEKQSGTIIKLYKTNIKTEKSARELITKLVDSEYKITGKGDRVQIKNPSPPFTTSTLQQEASRKLGYSIQRTMIAAQHLYEAGHITYMRTDSINLSTEAIKNIGDYIKSTYGNNYHNEKHYKAKSKNTQEAHESIRPTHIENTGISQSGKVGNDETRLYNLIWKRAIASQMSSAKLNISSTQISISKTKEYYFQSEISSIIFDGFLKVYNVQNIEESNNLSDSNSDISIKIPEVNDKLKLNELNSTQSYKTPPSRYNEASLVNKLDPKNLNIGRPSTYASIITKIHDRGYVEKKDNIGISKDVLTLKWNSKEKEINEIKSQINIGKDSGKICPTAIGTLVCDFLVQYFPELMEYKFTSNMEEKLDNIAEGKLDMLKLLKEFYYTDFHPIIEILSKEKIKYVDKDMKEIGTDNENNKIFATIRRYGPVVFMQNQNGKEINIAPLKEPLTIDTVSLQDALQILSYPKVLGKIDNKITKLFKGKFGFYAKYGDKTVNLSKITDEKDITIDKIKELIQEKKSNYLWEGKDGKVEYILLDGQYGKYFKITDTSKKSNKPLNIKLPQNTEIKDLTLDKVKNIVEEGKKNKFKKTFKKKD